LLQWFGLLCRRGRTLDGALRTGRQGRPPIFTAAARVDRAAVGRAAPACAAAW